jgi:hypothetical protein
VIFGLKVSKEFRKGRDEGEENNQNKSSNYLEEV